MKYIIASFIVLTMATPAALAEPYEGAYWASLNDYQERVLTVPVLEYSEDCTNGVKSLGDYQYYVPPGVPDSFKCQVPESSIMEEE